MSKFSNFLNQFGFIPIRLTIEAIYILRKLIEKYKNWKKDLHMTFINLEMAYDKVTLGLLWVLEKEVRYINLIKDVYDTSLMLLLLD